MPPRQRPFLQHPPAQPPDDRFQPAKSYAAAQCRRDDKIRAPAFFAIRHLSAQDFGKALLTHSRPAHHAFALQTQRRRNDQREINAVDPAAFEQERYVEHDKRFAPGTGTGDESRFSAPDHRMEDPLEPAQRRRVAEHPPAQLPAIDAARLVADIGKRRFDRPNRGPTRSEQPVNLRVGVEYRHAEPAQRRRGVAFPHPDRAGKAENNHRDAASVASTATRNSRVTRTGVPNHASNPGRP